MRSQNYFTPSSGGPSFILSDREKLGIWTFILWWILQDFSFPTETSISSQQSDKQLSGTITRSTVQLAPRVWNKIRKSLVASKSNHMNKYKLKIFPITNKMISQSVTEWLTDKLQELLFATKKGRFKWKEYWLASPGKVFICDGSPSRDNKWCCGDGRWAETWWQWQVSLSSLHPRPITPSLPTLRPNQLEAILPLSISLSKRLLSVSRPQMWCRSNNGLLSILELSILEHSDLLEESCITILLIWTNHQKNEMSCRL